MKLYSEYKHASISMSEDKDFKDTLLKMFSTYSIKNVVESGTFLGKGSTTLLSESILKTNRKLEGFYTIEVDKRIYLQAKKYLTKYPFVTPIWGLSVRSDNAISFVEQDEAISNHQLFPEVYIDDVKDPKSFYLNEVKGSLFQKQKASLWKLIADLFEKKGGI